MKWSNGNDATRVNIYHCVSCRSGKTTMVIATSAQEAISSLSGPHEIHSVFAPEIIITDEALARTDIKS